MKTKYYIPFILGSLLFLAALSVSCNDDDDLGAAPRLFTPVFSDESTATGNSIYLKWDKYTGAERYVLAISKDNFATDPIATFETDTTFYTIRDLEWDTQYQVRIQAFGNNVESYETFKTVKTDDYPTKLITPVSDDVIDNAVRVKWSLSDDVYDKLEVVDGNDEIVKTVDITPDEYQTGEMIIAGLSPQTTYRVSAYVGSEYKGKKTYTTLAAQAFEGSVVDLRDLTDEEASDYITTDFIAGLEDNTTVVLNGGTAYKISGATFTQKAVKFITGYSFQGKAIFAISSDFKMPADIPTSKIEFESIYFYTPDADETTSNYGAKYIFNLNPGKATYVSFEGCEFKFFRGIARLQGAGSEVGKMIMNNCIFNRVAGYGLMNVDNAGATLSEMVLTNSTVLYADKVLVNSKSTTTTSVTVDHCTFCYSPASGSGSYMFDFNGQNPTIQLTNSIFGPSTVPGSGAPYFRAASAPTVDNCYATSDYMVYINPTTLLETGPIPDIIKYNKSITDIFADPANFDFTIKDNSFPDKDAGDPRWR